MQTKPQPTNRLIWRCSRCKATLTADYAADALWHAMNEQRRCPKCHRWIYPQRLFATHSTKHLCDPRCLNATGFDCECSCGGKNHGLAYASTWSAETDHAEPATMQAVLL